MPDLTLVCADCGKEFVFSEDEQQYFRRRNWKSPRSCPICRAMFKARRQQFSRPPVEPLTPDL